MERQTMSENHPSKPIRKAGPTTGELVLDRGLALHLLDQMDVKVHEQSRYFRDLHLVETCSNF